MTTGPENYRKAQVLLVDAEENFNPGDPEYLALATAAGALATLALAAATALGHREVPAGDEDSFSTSNLPYDDYNAWWKAASEGPAARQRREEAARAEREEFADEECVRCGAAIWFRENVWLDSTQGEGCTDNSGQEGVHVPYTNEEERLTPQPGLYRDAHGRQHEKPYGTGF